jgi:hypothetical protein
VGSRRRRRAIENNLNDTDPLSKMVLVVVDTVAVAAVAVTFVAPPHEISLSREKSANTLVRFFYAVRIAQVRRGGKSEAHTHTC